MLKKTIVVLGAIAVAMVLLYLRVNHQARQLPDNNPAAFLEEKQSTSGKKIVVCIGDGHVQGISKLLEQKQIPFETIRLQQLQNWKKTDSDGATGHFTVKYDTY